MKEELNIHVPEPAFLLMTPSTFFQSDVSRLTSKYALTGLAKYFGTSAMASWYMLSYSPRILT
jgi:hypothetical protein